MHRMILTLGTAYLLTATGIPAAVAVSAVPAPVVATASVPAEAPCLPVPAVGLACGALGTVGHVVPTPDMPQIPGLGGNPL